MNPDEMPPVPPVPTSAPVSTPPLAAPAPEAVAPVAAPRAGHGKAIAAIAAIAVLALLGAGYAWAYRGAAAVLPAATEKLAAAASFRSSVNMEISAEVDGESFAGSVQFEGDVDQSDPENPKTQLTVDGEIDGLSASAEMRLVDGNLYFQATKIPGAGLAGDPSLDAMLNQWFFVSLEELEALAGETASPEAADDAQESFGRLIDSGAVSFSSPRVAKFNGEYAREYAVSVDADKLADFTIEEMRRLATTTESREAVDEIGPVVRAVLKAVSVSESKVRVALFSGELRAFEGAFAVDISKIDYEAIAEAAGEVADPEDMQGKVTLKVSATYADYGKPVNVEAPVGATSLMGMLGGMPTEDADLYYSDSDIVSGSTGSYRQEDVDRARAQAQQKTALLDVRASAALHYDETGSFEGFCESSRYEPFHPLLQGSDQEAMWASCFADQAGWIVLAQLADGTLFCSDAGGYYGAISEDAIPESGTSCV